MADFSFDTARWRNNVLAVARQKNMKIGDLERAAGVRVGYLSRFAGEDNTSLPNIDVAVAIAAALGVSLDALIGQDLTALSATGMYFLNLIKRLHLDTMLDELTWHFVATRAELQEVPVSTDNNHRLARSLLAVMGKAVEEKSQSVKDGCYTIIRGELLVCLARYQEGQDYGYVFSVATLSTKDVVTFSYAKASDAAIWKALSALYDEAVSSVECVQIAPKLQSAIDAYMARATGAVPKKSSKAAKREAVLAAINEAVEVARRHKSRVVMQGVDAHYPAGGRGDDEDDEVND